MNMPLRVRVARGATVAQGDKRSRSLVAEWVSGVVLVGVVAALTFAIRAHELPLTPFVASARKVASGELWVLPASALVVDKPLLIGLMAFAVLAGATLRFCGTRTFWLAAVAGHTGSTLLVYSIIGTARLEDPDAFAHAVVTPDFGVSAMQGAWVGALAVTAWRWAGASGRNRSLVAAGVSAVAGVGWWLHPDPSVLTTEHLFAFLIGCAIVCLQQQLAADRTAGRLRLAASGGRPAQHV